MSKIFSLPNLYVVLWGLYFTQGAFIPQGSILSRITLVLYLLISFYYLVQTFIKYRVNFYLKRLGWLLVMFTFYGLVGMINGDSFSYLKSIYLSLLPTFPFYVFTLTNKTSSRWVRSIFIVLFVVVIVQYLLALRLNQEMYFNSENQVVNVGYEFLALLPLIYFWNKRPIVQFLLLALIMAIILSTVKRGAILIGFMIMVYFLYNSLISSHRKIKWYIWLLVPVFVFICIRYVLDFYENNLYAQMRIASTLAGESSSRDQLYLASWDLFTNSNIFNMLFGHGPESTFKLLGNFAHNDWLEILVNQGLIGEFLYLIYWISFIMLYKSAKYTDICPVFGSLIIIYFMSSLFSMSYGAMTLPANLALGYSMGQMIKGKSLT